MGLPGHKGHRVKRVVLPSGKTIEVVYFDDEREATTVQETREMHLCQSCDSRLVYPTDWAEAGPRHWEVELRCPNCLWTGSGTYSQDVVERFDRELDRGTESLVEDLKRMMRSNMEEEIDRFMDAVDRDLILPEDF